MMMAMNQELNHCLPTIALILTLIQYQKRRSLNREHHTERRWIRRWICTLVESEEEESRPPMTMIMTKPTTCLRQNTPFESVREESQPVVTTLMTKTTISHPTRLGQVHVEPRGTNQRPNPDNEVQPECASSKACLFSEKRKLGGQRRRNEHAAYSLRLSHHQYKWRKCGKCWFGWSSTSIKRLSRKSTKRLRLHGLFWKTAEIKYCSLFLF